MCTESGRFRPGSHGAGNAGQCAVVHLRSFFRAPGLLVLPLLSYRNRSRHSPHRANCSGDESGRDFLTAADGRGPPGPRGTSMPELIFWLCITAVAYNYAGYPLLLFVISVSIQAKSDFLYLVRRHSRRRSRAAVKFPRVAVLISAHNEETVIEAKVRN